MNPVRLDLDAIIERHAAASRAAEEDVHRPELPAALADIPNLVSEVEHLNRRLTRARRRYANLAAAARAVLGAAEDGEIDPLAYLRDELEVAWPVSAPPGVDWGRC